MEYPKITIVTPVFNQVQLIEQTILSVLDQNYPNLEYIIIDGGSTDGTVDIIRKHESKLAYWVSEPDNGMYDAIQKGFNHSTGEIMAWLNADDMYHRGALFSIAEIFQTFPNVEWIEGLNTFWDNHPCGGRTLGVYPSRVFSKYEFLLGDYQWIQQESTVWRKSLWDKSGGLNTKLKYAGDFALWLSFFKHTKKYNVDVLIGGFRNWNKKQKSKNGFDKYIEECNYILGNEIVSLQDRDIIKRYKKHKIINSIVSKISFLSNFNLIESRFRAKHFGYPPRIYYSFEESSFKMQL